MQLKHSPCTTEILGSNPSGAIKFVTAVVSSLIGPRQGPQLKLWCAQNTKNRKAHAVLNFIFHCGISLIFIDLFLKNVGIPALKYRVTIMAVPT